MQLRRADWLNAQERAWLDAHPVVRVGADPDFAPYTFVDDAGRPAGLAADYLRRIGPMLGVRFEQVALASWGDVLAASRAGRIDMIAAAARNAERETWLAFSQAYVTTPLAAITRTQQLRLASVDMLQGRRVALVRGYGASQRVLDRLPGLDVLWVDSALAGLVAVASGDADAYIGVLGVALHLMHLHGLSNLKPNVGFEAPTHGQHMAVRKDWAPLAALLDKALAHIDRQERLALQARWMPQGEPRAASAAGDMRWHGDEQAWLAQAPTVRVGVPTAMAPFASAVPGEAPDGLAVDLLLAVARHSGLRFEFVTAPTLQGVAEMLRDRVVDVALSIDGGEARALKALPTQVFYDSTYLLVCPRDIDCVTAFDRGSRVQVAVASGSAAATHLQRRPSVVPVEVAGPAQAVRQVAAGGAQAAFGEARVLLRALEAVGDDGKRLQVGGAPAWGDMHLRLLVRNDWAPLASVIDSAMHALGDGALSEMRARWAGPPSPPPDSALQRQLQRVLDTVALAGAAVGLGLLWLGWWNRRLRAEVRRRGEAEQALTAAKARAEAASLHKSEFVANTSHELRTPLNAIVGTQAMLEDSTLDGRQRRLLDIQRLATRSLLGLVDDLLDLARMETGALPLREAPFGLRGLLDDCLTMVRDDAGRKGLRLTQVLDDGLPERFHGDGPRLQQVLVNLLANAVKYTDSGTVTLRLQGNVEGTAGRWRLRFAVEDTGPGIPPDQQQHIFEPYGRGVQATARGVAGVGLGLSIAQHVVEGMGGTLALDSRPGAGSRFHFTLSLRPASDDAAGRAAPVVAPLAADDGRLQGLRVLLVEDNEVNRLIAGEVLGQRGCDVLMAVDGGAALAAMATQPAPQIVLLDVGLPDIDGFEVARRLRRLPGEAGRVPIVGLTARALLHEREQCLRAGMDDVVHKPFDPDQLWRRMRLALAQADERAPAPPASAG